MRFRKIVAGVLIASTLSLSAPAFADEPLPPPPVGFAWVLGLAGFVLVAVAIVDTSRSP
jgi:hypothetical protein